jgi:hypothetical protein
MGMDNPQVEPVPQWGATKRPRGSWGSTQFNEKVARDAVVLGGRVRVSRYAVSRYMNGPSLARYCVYSAGSGLAGAVAVEPMEANK